MSRAMTGIDHHQGFKDRYRQLASLSGLFSTGDRTPWHAPPGHDGLASQAAWNARSTCRSWLRVVVDPFSRTRLVLVKKRATIFGL